MKLAPLALLLGSLVIGCAPAASTKGTAALPSPTAAAAVEAPVAPELEIRIATDGKLAGLVSVELRLSDALFARGLRFDSSRAKLGAVRAEDADGEIDLARDIEGAAVGLKAKRAPRGPVAVRYSVTLEPGGRGAFTAVSEATDLRVEGRDVLLLPNDGEPVPVALSLAVGAGRAQAASTFAVGADQRFTARPAELAAASFIAGDLGHAQFRANDGDDFTAWAGFTAFDARWVAAETAGVRSAMDDYVGAQPHDRRVITSFLLVPEPRDQPTVSIKLALRGLVASVDPRATWSPAARLRVAQALAQRTIGGRIWIGSREDEAGGQFFSEGFSRAVAQEVLAQTGIFEPADRAVELNTLMQTLDLSPLGSAPATELAAATDKREALRVTTARGALVALTLGAKLGAETKGKASLKTLIRALVTRAGKRDSLAFGELAEATVALAPGAQSALQPLTAGGEVPVPSDLIGACYRLERGKVAPFELGFEVEGSAEGLRVRGVVAGSAAARAGLRDGDVLSALSYEDGRSDVPVSATRVGAGAGTRPLRFAPAGKAKPGRYFRRVKGARESDC
jgi:hypothetical protein